MPEPEIVFSDVTKSFDLREEEGFFKGDAIFLNIFRKKERSRKVIALKDFSFKVYRGECVGIVGPNGAGKTTLLKLACSLLLPDEGDILVKGLNTKYNYEKTRLLTMIVPGSRFFGFNELLSPETNLRYWAAVYQLSPKEAVERVRWVLKLTGLEEVKNRRVMYLSSGMRQKLNIARSLLARREIIALDEPTIHLDPWSATEIRKFIKEVLTGKLHCTILLSSQNLYEVEELCDRIVVLVKGKKVIEGTTEYIKNRLGVARKRLIITFNDSLSKEEIKMFECFEIDIKNNKVIIYIKNEKNIKEILELLYKVRNKVLDLEVKTPSLEEVLIRGGVNIDED